MGLKVRDPFFSITVDDTHKEGLYSLKDEAAPIKQIINLTTVQ